MAIPKTDALRASEPPKPSNVRKLGIYYLITLPLGILLDIGCVVLLLLLWYGDSTNETWQRIVLGGWMSRCVVILSLIIRLSAGGHAVMCVSMLAAVALEGFDTPLVTVPAISLLRFQNNGATDLWFFGFLLRRKHTIRKYALLLPAFLVLLCLQLTSTALLSDFGPRNITVAQPEAQISYGLNGSSLRDALGADDTFMLMAYPNYPAFIEHSIPAYGLLDGMSDTGTSIRGFLPVSRASERSALARYSGVAVLCDTRIVCVRPSDIATKLQFSLSTGSIDNPTPLAAEIYGVANTTYSISGFNGTNGGAFNCAVGLSTVIGTVAGLSNEWLLYLCSVDVWGGLISSMREPPWSIDSDFSQFNEAFLVVNVTGSPYDWVSVIYGNNTTLTSGRRNFTLKPTWSGGDWLGFEFEESLGFPISLGFSVSLCYSVISAQYRDVDVVRDSLFSPEPTASWDSYSQQFDTRDIRQQFGASLDIKTFAERSGLFRFRETPSPESLIAYTSNGSYLGFGQYPPVLDFATGLIAYNATSLQLCASCETASGMDSTISYIHPLHAAVFTGIVRDHLSPVMALQALHTSRYTQNYYANNYMFALNASGTIWTMEVASAPAQSLFLYLIISTLAIKVALVLLMTIAFLKNTQYSTLGSSWQVISHVTGDSVDSWLRDSNTSTDREVERCMKAAGVAWQRVGLDDDICSRRRVIRPYNSG